MTRVRLGSDGQNEYPASIQKVARTLGKVQKVHPGHERCTCACRARAPDAPPAAADAPSPGLAASLVEADTLRTTVSLQVLKSMSAGTGRTFLT